MQLPVQITFRNIEASHGLDALIRERAAGLARYHGRLMACRVLVEVPHRHRQAGARFHVRIDLTVPGGEIVVSHEPSLVRSLKEREIQRVPKAADVEPAHQYVAATIHEAFKVARRRLQDYVSRQRGDVKAHEAPAHGQVVRLGPEEGWIRTPDGREVYFHEHAVLGEAFERLDIGSEVAFAEEAGEKGPQASTVRPLGKHHYEDLPV